MALNNNNNPAINPAATQNTNTSSDILKHTMIATSAFIGGFYVGQSFPYVAASLPFYGVMRTYSAPAALGWCAGFLTGSLGYSNRFNPTNSSTNNTSSFFSQNNQLCYADADLQNNNYCPNPSFNM